MIELKYKCRCTPVDRAVWVLLRIEKESSKKFMGRVVKAVSDAHRELSPLCREKRLEYIKIPMKRGEALGRS